MALEAATFALTASEWFLRRLLTVFSRSGRLSPLSDRNSTYRAAPVSASRVRVQIPQTGLRDREHIRRYGVASEVGKSPGAAKIDPAPS
jgi:hypothetical protein